MWLYHKISRQCPSASARNCFVHKVKTDCLNYSENSLHEVFPSAKNTNSSESNLFLKKMMTKILYYN